MDVREKLVELLNKVQDTGVVEIQAGFGITHGWVKNELVASHLIANGVTVQEWISVKDRLPESEKCVLIYSKDGKVAEGKYNARFDEWTQFRWNVTEVRNVTHWMPLPEAPKGE